MMSFDLSQDQPPLVIVVGSGGVGKTTLAAAMGLVSAEEGHDTLVMTFDPSLRLKDTLGVGEAARDEAIEVATSTPGVLHASLLDARRTFDRLVARYAPDDAARQRILENPYYDRLASNLGGILEYMAVEKLYEVAESGRYGRVILDTPPTHQALDFLEAPRRIVDFLDSGALDIALKPWFDGEGRLRTGESRLGRFLGRGLEDWFDRLVGLQLLRDMSEFFRAFAPLFQGFRRRAEAVEALLAKSGTVFVLVAGPGAARIPDTLFFARRLKEAGYRLGPVVVNRIHPEFAASTLEGEAGSEGRGLFQWLGEGHRHGLEELASLLGPEQILVPLPLAPDEPTDLPALAAFGRRFQDLCRSTAKSP